MLGGELHLVPVTKEKRNLRFSNIAVKEWFGCSRGTCKCEMGFY